MRKSRRGLLYMYFEEILILCNEIPRIISYLFLQNIYSDMEIFPLTPSAERNPFFSPLISQALPGQQSSVPAGWQITSGAGAPLGLIQCIIPVLKTRQKCLAGSQPRDTVLYRAVNIFLEEEHTVITHLVKPCNFSNSSSASNINNLMLKLLVAFPSRGISIKGEE